MEAWVISSDVVFNYYFTLIAYPSTILVGFFLALSLLRK